jgi:hypothetical protein
MLSGTREQTSESGQSATARKVNIKLYARVEKSIAELDAALYGAETARDAADMALVQDVAKLAPTTGKEYVAGRDVVLTWDASEPEQGPTSDAVRNNGPIVAELLDIAKKAREKALKAMRVAIKQYEKIDKETAVALTNELNEWLGSSD